jgi:prophage antirepressor-like protein
MEIVRAFNTNEMHTEIVIKGTVDEPLFRASDIGEILEITTIRSVIRDFNDSEKVVHTMHTLGGSQQVTFLTEKGLYKVLFKSRKPIAEKFQNWVCEVIKEIRLHGLYDLQKALEQAKTETVQVEKEYDHKLQKQKALEREKVLLAQYGVIGDIVYIVKVKTFANGTYVVKIGESRAGITKRYAEHKSKYEECLLLDCFKVQRSKAFETFLQDHESIRQTKVSDLPGHETERELFLIGKQLSYQTLLQIANKNEKYFNEVNLQAMELENEKLKSMLETKENGTLLELIEQVKRMSNKIDNLEKMNVELASKFNSSQTKTTTNFQQPLVTLGPKLQQINPETMTVNKVYESIAECIKEYNFKVKRPSITKAIHDNTIYHGYRWAFIERTAPDPTIVNISETKKTKTQNLGYIVKMDSEKTKILNVYLDRKTAALCNGYQSSSALDTPVKTGKLANGFYYSTFSTFEKSGAKSLLLYKAGIGQFNEADELIQEFSCKYDCIKQLKISDKTLAKALDKNVPYNRSYFKSLGSKLSLY